MFMKINGKEEHFNKIIIYGDGNKLYEIDNDIFKPCEIKKNKYGNMEIHEQHYNFEIANINFSQEIKWARKENLNRKDNYFLYYDCSYLRRKYIALYIHHSEIEVEALGDILAMETIEEKNYLAAFKLKFKNDVDINTYHIEKIPCDKHWELPKNGKWSSCYGTKESPCFDVYRGSIFKKEIDFEGVIKRWIEEETRSNLEIIVTQRYCTKREYSEERKRKMELANAINESNLFKDHYSYYDIEKLERVFNNLTIREKA